MATAASIGYLRVFFHVKALLLGKVTIVIVAVVVVWGLRGNQRRQDNHAQSRES